MPIDLIARGLGLVPIAAGHIERGAAGLTLLAVNAAFRRAGLVGPASPLLAAAGPRIEAFLDSTDLARRFAWRHGDAIDGRHYDVHLARSDVRLRDACQVHLIDETARHRTETSLKQGLTTDALTGLPNREGFVDAMAAALAGGTSIAVLVIDLDRFGRLNACLGGLVADELLITVARRIRGTLRAGDTLARIGGDEFGLLLATADRADAGHAAKRIEQTLVRPFRLTDYEIGIDCSIGIAFGDGGGDAETLIRHAQFAVKHAQASGRVETYQAQAFTRERERFGIETRLRRAIDNRELRLTFQPICDLATGRAVAVEALARWRTPEGEDIAPSVFIPVAEESGLIVPLGRWAIAEALATLAAWDARAGLADRPDGLGIQMSVNLSPIQFQRDALVGVVRDALAANRLSGHRVKLEITESALVAEPERVASVLNSLKELGVTIAMDDFGTGYSSLAFLGSLPIDVLKIDRSFVTAMLADRDKLAIVRAVLSLAQALGMRTVAEGVECDAHARVLDGMGCREGQGYHYARALEADDAYDWLMARR